MKKLYGIYYGNILMRTTKVSSPAEIKLTSIEKERLKDKELHIYEMKRAENIGRYSTYSRVKKVEEMI